MKKKTLFDLRRELGAPTEGTEKIYEIFYDIKKQAHRDLIRKPKYERRDIVNTSYKELLDTLSKKKIK